MYFPKSVFSKRVFSKVCTWLLHLPSFVSPFLTTFGISLNRAISLEETVAPRLFVGSIFLSNLMKKPSNTRIGQELVYNVRVISIYLCLLPSLEYDKYLERSWHPGLHWSGQQPILESICSKERRHQWISPWASLYDFLRCGWQFVRFPAPLVKWVGEPDKVCFTCWNTNSPGKRPKGWSPGGHRCQAAEV